MKRVYIEITNICNMNCSFCSPCVRKSRMMTVEEFARIIREVKPYSPQIYLHVKGEPLMHSNLAEILDICRQNNLPVNLTTNGVLIASLTDSIIGSRIVRQVNISVHSFEQGSPCEQRLYLNDIANFGRVSCDNGLPYVVYRMWKGDMDSIDQVSKLSVDYLCEVFDCEASITKRSGKDSIKLEDNVYINFDNQFTWPSLDLAEVASRGKCLGGRDMLGILVDGTVVPCCLDGDGIVNLGNIYQESLASIMESPKYLELVKGFCGGNISEDLCKRCSYRLRFDKVKE